MKTTTPSLLARHPSVVRLCLRLTLTPCAQNVARALSYPQRGGQLNPRTGYGQMGSSLPIVYCPTGMLSDLVLRRLSRRRPELRRGRESRLGCAEMVAEVRRARADAAYRRTLQHSLRPVRVRSLRALDRYVSEQPGRARTAQVLEAAGVQVAVRRLPANAAILPVDLAMAQDLGVPVVRRGKGWLVRGDAVTSYHHAAGVTRWKRGRPVEYSRAENVTTVRALALVTGPQAVRISLHGHPDAWRTVDLTQGVRWDVDDHGLRLLTMGGRDDYHPTAADLMRGDWLAHCLSRLREGAETRRRLAAEAAAEAAEAEGVSVCFADSLRAGNCRAGTESFAARHGLDPRRHYAAPELLRRANGDAPRVRLAVKAAVIRHRREMAQGYALLSEHVA